MPQFVYILQSKSSGKFYIGTTGDVKRRLGQHNAGYSRATRAGIPWELRRVEEFPTLARAGRREAQIKRMKSRTWISRLLGERADEIGQVRGSPIQATVWSTRLGST